MKFETENFGSKVAAISDNGGSITYEQLGAFTKEISTFIASRSLVFSLCRNSIGSLAGYVGFINNRIVPLLLSENLDAELYQSLIKTYQPAYVWAPEEMSNIDGDCILNKYGYKLYKTNNPTVQLFDELGLLLTTSGSTGSPKLVRQSYTNLKANTESIVEYLALTEEERPITTLPMNYTYGLSIVNTHLYVGGTVLLTEKSILNKDFWDFFRNEKATSFGGVPYTYEMLNKLKFFDMELPYLKTMTQAGGKLSPELHQKFAEYAKNMGKRFVVMYGQTEATARMAYLPYDRSLEKYGSMGVAIPGGHFELIDVEGTIIHEPECVGELVYKGKNVTLGYAECLDDLQKGDERQGVLVTGDMAKMDSDGYYYIVGRKKRFLKIFGNRVNLDEIERMVKSNFYGIECACAGMDDKMYIFVVQDNREINIQDIKKFVAEKTRLHSSALKIKKIDVIPKNEAGKVLYSALNQYYDE